jgi:hypothetical protein
MIDEITVTRNEIWKGAARLLISDPTLVTSFPGALESVMNPGTPADGGAAYALASGWNDLGPTTEDGITLKRSAETSDGIALDQRRYNLDEGEPEGWEMNAESELLHSSQQNFVYAWEAGGIRAIAGSGSNVAQHRLDFDAPSSFTERMFAAVQEDPKTERLRVFVFRKVVPEVDGEVQLSSEEETALPVAFKLKADPSISEGQGQFGRMYQEDAS